MNEKLSHLIEYKGEMIRLSLIIALTHTRPLLYIWSLSSVRCRVTQTKSRMMQRYLWQ